MNLTELTRDEQTALVALIEMSLMVDRELTDAEHAQLDEIVHEMGEERFRELIEEAEKRLPDRDAMQAFLRGITRQDARELIYGTVLSGALLETMPHDEARFLEWLGQEWQVPVQVEEPGEPSAER
jgi:UDP-N-acetyl-D-mannosaminuronic acid transferase (WecB/TagA/CpsF family)